jgi:hypothetical protein
VTKLSDIIDGATREQESVASLLRMVKVVATRLGIGELESWVNMELGGYPSEELLPSYRGPFSAEVMGTFSGPFGSMFELAIPPRALPVAVRDSHAFKVSFLQPIIELEELVDRPPADTKLGSPWPADWVALINRGISDGNIQLVPMHRLSSAHRVVTSGQVRGVIDNVRTRVLNLALDLEKLEPNAGEPDTKAPDQAAVTNVVNNIIYGSANLAIGSTNFDQTTSALRGNLRGLLDAVKDAGLSQGEVDELGASIRDDEAEAGAGLLGEPGPRVRDFLGRQALRAGGVAGKVGIGATGAVVAGLVKAYFGIS